MRGVATAYAQQYAAALLAGQEGRGYDLLQRLLQGGLPLELLYDRVIARAMQRIGEAWAQGKVSVAQEHLASQTVFHHVERLQAQFPPRVSLGLRAVVAVVEGESHRLAVHIFAGLLRSDGWEVFFLGEQLPTGHLIDFVRHVSPQLVALSISLPELLPRLREALAGLRALMPRPKVIVGGRGVVGPDRERKRLAGADAICHSVSGGLSWTRRVANPMAQPEPVDYVQRYALWLRYYRRTKGLSQEEVARLSGLQRAYISAIEKGRQNLTLITAARIARALDQRLEDLLQAPPPGLSS